MLRKASCKMYQSLFKEYLPAPALISKWRYIGRDGFGYVERNVGACINVTLMTSNHVTLRGHSAFAIRHNFKLN